MLMSMRFDVRAAGPALALALASAALLSTAALCGCASRPQELVPAPTLSLTAGPAELLDQNRALVRIDAALRNPRTQAFSVESAECSVAVEGAGTALGAERLSGAANRIEAEGELSIVFECVVDLRDLEESLRGPEGPAEAAFSAAAHLRLRAPDGALFEIVAATDGSIPIVREPEIRISSLRIERDVLVTSMLRLGIELRNPNAFPIELGMLSYAFYGEKKKWASGSEAGSFPIPAKASSELDLVFEMNFADVDRSLFDLVAKLGIIGYKLSGHARVAAGLEAIPSFELDFDIEGACPVER